MTETEFRSRMIASSLMTGSDYRIGYQHGLRCNYYGQSFSPPEVHHRWLMLGGELGDGYRDGFRGAPPRQTAVHVELAHVVL